MSRLIRLYPAEWRTRYEDEFLALLAERPPTIRDRVDIARGALDARLHPQTVRPDRHPIPFAHRLPGLAAIAAGLLFAAAYLGVALSPEWESSWGSLIGLSFVLAFISLPGTYFERYARQLKWGFGAGAVCLLAARVLPWPLMTVPMLFAFVLVAGGMLALAAARAGSSARARWTLLGLVLVLPMPVVVPFVVGLADAGVAPLLVVAAVLPYGLAWIAVGVRMAVRGTPTFLPATPPPALEDPVP
jgi:hypothetical protein